MPNVSGFVYYDPTRTGVPGTGLSKVPVALYDTASGKGAVALTDAAGAYLFTNVPAGNYNLVETWGTAGTLTPVNFTAAETAMALPPEIEPPLSIVTVSVPALADALNAVTPNLLKMTMAGSDIAGKNFYDAAVGNQPLNFTGVTFSGSNLITAATNGTWGAFPGGTAISTTNPVAPYPGVTPGFTYSTSPNPNDGSYTVMNTRVAGGPWWAVSDHTSKVETGRFILVNGAHPGAVIFTQPVNVTPNTDYGLSAWVLNLIDLASGYADPQLSLKVLGSDSSVLYYQKVKPIDSTPIPIWYQNGFLFNTAGYSSITVEILSEGPAAQGNDFLIDDITLYKARIEDLLSVKKAATPPIIYAGTNVTLTVTVTNTSTQTINNVFFNDVLDSTLVFIPGSVTVNGSGAGYGAADPNAGFSIGSMNPSAVKIVQFQATATAGPSPVKNVATTAYTIAASGTGDIITHTITSNPVFLRRPKYNFGQPSADLTESIATQQAALSHLLNAEGEKIQAMLAQPDITAAQLLALNSSVQNTVDSISSLECIMQHKLKTLKNQLVGYQTQSV